MRTYCWRSPIGRRWHETGEPYPLSEGWKAISLAIRERAMQRCEQCQAENGQPNPVTGSRVVLTVAHLDHQPENCAPENLRAWCQLCHLAYDRPHHIARRAANRRARQAAEGDADR